jgi:hypothetical protein
VTTAPDPLATRRDELRNYVVEVPSVTVELEVEAAAPFEAIERARDTLAEEARTVELVIRPGTLDDAGMQPTFAVDELAELEGD